MSGDYSRVRFDPLADFSGVQMQQGRVQLDSDWNEWVAILDRRTRAESVDTFGIHPKPGITGVAVVSPQTPDAFKIEAGGGELTIGIGRMYVDGLLAENHGKGTLHFDPVLAELNGSDALRYGEQPYHPAPAEIAETERYLAYLEVWQREVTHLQRPDLVENAVGVDTTTRLQTVWQVRLMEGIGIDENCATPDALFPAWRSLIQPSAARVSIASDPVSTESNPCLLPPGGGYRGMENQLYRIEIHDGGDFGTATFKWSRDNASVASNVVDINFAGDELVLSTLGRDDVLRFNIGDWVEILDDYREFSGIDGDARKRHGELKKIVDIDEATQTITLSSALPAEMIPGGGETPDSRHTRVIRWDQSGVVRKSDNSVIVDLDSAASDGLIPIPSDGSWVVLERGIRVQFNLDSAGGDFHCGDYWVSAARTENAHIEEFADAPPRGIHHHFTRLAFITYSGDVTDCRSIWPSSSSGCCTYTVGDGVHSHGDYHSIQQAINDLPGTGGRICVLPGEYRENLTISQDNITLRGCGTDSSIIADTVAPVIHIDGASNIEIEALQIMADAGGEGIHVDDASGGTPENILLHHLDIHADTKSAIAVSTGQHIDINNNIISTQITATESTIFVTADDIHIEHNTVSADGSVAGLAADSSGYGAIQIGGASEGVWISDNLISGGGGNGITLGSVLEVMLASMTVRVAAPLYDVHIERNRILDMGMNGISVLKFFDLSGEDGFISVIGLDIVGNTVRGCLQRTLAQPPSDMVLDMAYGGICLADVEMLSLRDNCIEDNGSSQPQGVCGVFILHGEGMDISRNRILSNGAEDSGDPGAASASTKGLRGGIVIKYAVPGITSLQIRGKGYPRQNGVPAVRIHDNVVSQPLGQALLMWALGPVSVQGNSFTSRGIEQSFTLGTVGCTVLIFNLGISNEFYLQLFTYAGTHTDSVSLAAVELEGEFITIPKKGLDDYGIGQYLANGNVIFNDNQVVADLMQPQVSMALSSVLIASLDDVSFANNQLDASFLVDVLMSNAIVLGMSARINDNRFKESLVLALFSAMSLGLMFNHTVDNQATHCIYAKGLSFPAEEHNNLILMNTLCGQLKKLFG